MMYVIDNQPVNVSGYYSSASQSAGRGSRRPDKSCCAPSRRCWIAVVVVAVLLQMLSLGGIGGLLELLRRATRPIEFVELVRDCSDCSRCYSCLSEDTGTTTRRICSWMLSRSCCFMFYAHYMSTKVSGSQALEFRSISGQPLEQICDVKDLNTVTQCAAQTYYIYSQPNVNNSIPCYGNCRKCRNCLDKLTLGSLKLTSLLWETVYNEYFTDSERTPELRGGTQHVIT